ncbi:hypothetical protein JYU15_01205, partial [bacterium AH-315-I18]|nr:hypothetical protein [Phycisphaeraceae bacterium]MBN4061031.1 hypothetical protein [bacterium AH-315-I18]
MKHWVLRIMPWLLASLLGACSPGPLLSEGGFNSPDPAARLYAIRRAGQQRDRLAVRPLIERLNSDDAAERLMSIQSLERITATRLDYDPYAPAGQREEAITRWVEFAQSPEFSKGKPQ